MDQQTPNCIIIPSVNNKLTNCIQMKLPSVGTLILMLILSWIVVLAVAYGIFWILNKQTPGKKYSYWWILLILIVAMIIASLLSSLFMRF